MRNTSKLASVAIILTLATCGCRSGGWGWWASKEDKSTEAIANAAQPSFPSLQSKEEALSSAPPFQPGVNTANDGSQTASHSTSPAAGDGSTRVADASSQPKTTYPKTGAAPTTPASYGAHVGTSANPSGGVAVQQGPYVAPAQPATTQPAGGQPSSTSGYPSAASTGATSGGDRYAVPSTPNVTLQPSTTEPAQQYPQAGPSSYPQAEQPSEPSGYPSTNQIPPTNTANSTDDRYGMAPKSPPANPPQPAPAGNYGGQSSDDRYGAADRYPTPPAGAENMATAPSGDLPKVVDAAGNEIATASHQQQSRPGYYRPGGTSDYVGTEADYAQRGEVTLPAESTNYPAGPPSYPATASGQNPSGSGSRY